MLSRLGGRKPCKEGVDLGRRAFFDLRGSERAFFFFRRCGLVWLPDSGRNFSGKGRKFPATLCSRPGEGVFLGVRAFFVHRGRFLSIARVFTHKKCAEQKKDCPRKVQVFINHII